MKLGRHILGRLLRLRRKQINKTVYELGQAIGVSHNAVSYFESGQLGIEADRLPQLAAAYRLDKRDLLAWWLVCRSFDEGVSLDDLQNLPSVFDRLAALLGWPRASLGAGRSPLELGDPGEPGLSPQNHGELQADFIRSVQTLTRMSRRGDFPAVRAERE